MDACKFGSFIAENRKAKSMTQADLAKKLQVTDKAVSRWERGLGFPDINTLEPLAEALDLSILELMKSEKAEEMPISQADTEKAIVDTLGMAIAQKHRERKKALCILLASIAASLLIILVDNTRWNFSTAVLVAFAVVLPLFSITAGIGCAVYGIWRKAHHKQAKQTFLMAIACFVIPVIFFAGAFMLPMLGVFPVPS